MAAEFYNQGRFEISKQLLNVETDTIKVAKMSPDYTPDLAAHQFYSDISASVVGTDQTLANVTTTKNDTDNAADTDADDTTETGVTFTTNRVVYYKDTGSPSTSTLIAYADLNGSFSVVSGSFDLVFDPRGFLSV